MERKNATGFTNFGAAAGPLTPPTLPFRFGRDQDFSQEQAHFRGGININNARDRNFPRSGNNITAPNVYRREPPPPFLNGGLQNGNVPRVTNIPKISTSRPPGLPISRSRSPPLSNEDQQKQKRLERFKPPQIENPVVETVMPRIESRKKLATLDSMEMQDVSTDDRDWRSTEPIIGVCLDMCAEAERSERERKGDLDWFERLDGERNQTSRELAVKKYTRTADRDPNIIRPLPVLRETMDYLLGLLNQPYNDDMLTLYNFLWDRMRAVRMDLRMQHIFNLEAIEMHEQMIRFHILAMHEFCEYSKGEGFTEGFDAHLNIEQMNKASVDLFQMYDEHRQQGSPVSNEAEFRGYYALLKLDKHPGYMVEPAELTADLAKMSPEMRNSSDILFARNVARACRLPNYVAFFRMARTATYLQACLMHAHFSKLRTQALASLHSGLKSSQGIPLAQITSWLGMERQEMENLLEYHGFSIKQFEEPYMVKEGVFLNIDRDYHTSRSRLVESKRSPEVVSDVLARKEASGWFPDRVQVAAASPPRINIFPSPPQIVDEEITDYEDEMQDQNIPPELEPVQAVPASPSFISSPTVIRDIFRPSTADIPISDMREDIVSMEQPVTPPIQNYLGKRQRQPENEPDHSPKRQSIEVIDVQAEEEKRRREEEQARQGEAFIGKAKLWLRRWKRRTVAKIEAARLRYEKAQAALASMSMGFTFPNISRVATGKYPSIHLKHVAAQRRHTLDNMWGYLDVPSLITPVFKAKYPQETSICWKLAIFSGAQQQQTPVSHQVTTAVAGHWLRSKLFGEDPKPVKRNQYTSPAETFVSKDVVDDIYCCYIAKDVGFDGTRLKSPASIYGVSAILFLVREDLTLEESCTMLHSMVDALPSGASLPLVVLSLQGQIDEQGLETNLELLDRAKISSWLVVPMTRSSDGFFSTEALVSGIKWLVSLAPSQPVLRPVNLRDLVREHLQRSLKVWTRHHSEVRPQTCISIFNQVLRDSAEELRSSARSSRSNWPPPEFGRPPQDWVGCSLPNSGWNEAANLQPIYDALSCCRLPFISTDNWQLIFSRTILGDRLLDRVREQYESVKDRLAEYVRNIDDNVSQAEALLEDSALLEWSGEECSIVIDWVRIFQGIFQNRLMLLNSEPPAIVYVVRKTVQEEDWDYEKKLNFASKLRCRRFQADGEMEFMEGICNVVMAPTRKISSPRKNEEKKDDVIERELLYLRSDEHKRCLHRLETSVDNRSVFCATKFQTQLDVVVGKAHEKLDRSLSDTGAVVMNSGTEMMGPSCTSIRPVRVGCESAAHAGKKFAELLRCCERMQLSNGGKLADYFGFVPHPKKRNPAVF